MISMAQWLEGLTDLLHDMELYVKEMRREDVLMILLERKDIHKLTAHFTAQTVAAFLNHYQGTLIRSTTSPAGQEAIRRVVFGKLLKHPKLRAILDEYVRWSQSSYKKGDVE